MERQGGSGTHGEARQQGNEIWIFPKFWKLARKIRDFVLAHEIGHFVQGRYGPTEFLQLGTELGIDLWDTSSLPFGQHNMDEAFADSFASYYLAPGELKSRYPEWKAMVERIKTARIRTDRDYCICPVTDGLLYVDVPSFDHLSSLLLTRRFRKGAHFRAKGGYTPHAGGGIAFQHKPLLLRGVKPIWYRKEGGDRTVAIEQLIEDGVYGSQRDAERAQRQRGYADECEWQGPTGMKFEPGWVVFAWHSRKASPEGIEQLLEIMPDLDLRSVAPSGGGGICKQG